MLNRNKYLYLAAMSFLCALTSIGYSHSKAAWIDEILQIHIARLPTAAQVWENIRGGSVQMDPPLLHMLDHFLIQTFGDSLLAVRMASIVGFILMCVCISLLLWRYVPAIYAAAAFFLPYATVLRTRVPDVRPYGMMLGFSALALLCWDSLNNPETTGRRRAWWRIGLLLSLAAMFSTHFYSILFLAGFGVAELVRLLQRKRPDWPLYGTVALAFIPYLIWLPTLLAAKRIYMQHYFFPVNFNNFYSFYSFAVQSLPLAGLLLFLLLILALAPRLEYREPVPPSDSQRTLLLACLGFLIVPLAGYLVGLLATGIFVNYYHIIATFGLIVGLPLVLSYLSGGQRAIGLALFAAIVGHGMLVTVRGISGFRRTDTFYPSLAAVRAIIPEPRPDIVLPSPLHFLSFQEANRTDPENNLVYLYDAKKALDALGTDTADLCHYYLKQITNSVRIEAFDPWLAQHPHFYIAVLGESIGVQEWQYDYLLRQARAKMTWLGKVGSFQIYRVDQNTTATVAPQ
ncbi:hypothetical protein [Bryobacter aggregatus]|uniref:hypothetical protein n=1 Tax=Bryobacter aggregatus TaxID=360054 RepID=UPI0004E1F7BA|nr:hypothetical protein [Bryobacter aggregatus]